MAQARWSLYYQARWWRSCMSFGMFLHRLAYPRPAHPAFTIKIPITLSPNKGTIELTFYVPAGYLKSVQSSSLGVTITKGNGSDTDSPYPVVVNFHGGGFTLGQPTDDARWASTVIDQVGAVVVSVGYRLAPEAPFPMAVEDGVDAILWLDRHADVLGLDRKKMALSGFSAGGNLCFTVPLRLEEELTRQGRFIRDGKHGHKNVGEPEHPGEQTKLDMCGLVAWYPTVDYTLNREEKRRSNPGGKSKSLSKVFTSLFDAAYIGPHLSSSPSSISSSSASSVYKHPYLSPGLAPDSNLINSLPHDIVVYTCEWDMLLFEGETFRERLQGLGKNVTGGIIPEVEHGWDRAPFLFWRPRTVAKMMKYYEEACHDLRRVFEVNSH
ncbi:MAG: hypothetical protein M1816_001297 [Peltula sp. TS41687]|nr:MAG: hypothetical protein M1816_001297 [Peltula sp. TS41687]